MTPSKVGCLPPDDPFHRTALCLLMTPSKVTSLLTPPDGQEWVFKMGDQTSFLSLLWASNHYGESRKTTLQAPSSIGGYPLPHLSCLFYLTTGMVGAVLPLLLLLFLCACSPWGPATLLYPEGSPARAPARGPA
jgi:hypothetical protein